MRKLCVMYPWPDFLVIETPTKDDNSSICEIEVFDRRTAGIIPALLSKFISKRKLYKKKLKEVTDVTEIKLYDNLQLVTKLVANSIYGLLGTKEFNLSAIDCAKTCTTIGRNMLKYIDNVVANVEFVEEGIKLKRNSLRFGLMMN